MPPIPSSSLQDQLYDRLYDRLQALPFYAFERTILFLLSTMGYHGVQTMGRKHKRGRTKLGGLDLEAYAQAGISEFQVLVQIKQYTRPVSRRFVDELRGTMLRFGASEGLLITTSYFSKPAKQAALNDTLVPIRLIEGQELLTLMLTNQVGLCQQERILSGESEWRLDEAFFDRMLEGCPTTKYGTNHTAKHAEAIKLGTKKSSRNSVPILDWLTSSDQRFRCSPESDRAEMTWRTHVLGGIASLWLLKALPDGIALDPLSSDLMTNLGMLSLFAAFGALLPDLDAEESKIKSLSLHGIRPFSPLAHAAYRTFGHRGVMHSLIGLGAIGGLTLPLLVIFGWLPYAALLLGYASHLALDACTKSGIPLFYPNKRSRFLLPRRLRFTTGSRAEEMLLPFLALIVFFLLMSQLPIVGLISINQ